MMPVAICGVTRGHKRSRARPMKVMPVAICGVTRGPAPPETEKPSVMPVAICGEVQPSYEALDFVSSSSATNASTVSRSK